MTKDIRLAIREALEAREKEILDLSRRIHADPETAFQEFRTSRLLKSVLSAEGFAVSGAGDDLPTAFRAAHRLGADRPCLTFTAEMDALPGLGHACGHNIIAAASTYAAVVLKSVVPPDLRGTIEVVGTPAEEAGSGKVRMIRNGAFSASDAVLQMHAHSLDTVVCQAMARRTLVVEYFGKAAHAAAAPQDGINALDALVLFYQSAALLRSRLPAGCLFHGIIEEGGKAPNIIPDYSRGQFSLRADSTAKAEKLLELITASAESAAAATGCRVKIDEPGTAATTFRRNAVLEDLFAGLFEERARTQPRKLRETYGSTDLANVSQVVPAIELMVKASDFPIHTEEFARAAAGAGGDRALLDGIYFLACGGFRLLTEPDLLARVQQAFLENADGK
jgi:amidohydrolase